MARRRATRRPRARRIEALEAASPEATNVMPLSIAAAKAGVTTGEWGAALREVLGEFRAPTGVVGGARRTAEDGSLDAVRAKVRALGDRLGRNVKVLIGKPGLDGHSNGAEQIALRARDAGFEVVYQGIRVTAAQLAQSAVEEGVHLVGLSVLSGSHNELVPEVLDALRRRGPREDPGRRGRHHPRGGRAHPRSARRREGLHAQGLRARDHHGRPGGARTTRPWTQLRPPRRRRSSTR